MPISYKKLFTLLKEKGYSETYWLRQHGIYPATVNKLKKDKQINTETIEKLCELLNCQPGDIMEYVKEEKL